MILFKKRSIIAVYSFGHAQLTGDREVQSDCFHLSSNAGTCSALIADGVMDKISSRNSARLAKEAFVQAVNGELYRKASVEYFFTEAFNRADRIIADNVYEDNTRVSLAAVLIDHGVLYFAEIHGNRRGSRLCLYRNDQLMVLKSQITYEPLPVLRFVPQKKDIFLLVSKGAAEGLTEMEIIGYLAQKKPPQAKADDLIRWLDRKRLVDQDNATILIMERIR